MNQILCALWMAAIPVAWGQAFSGAAELDDAITQAIHENRIPGAVLLIGHHGQVVYRKAYGRRAEIPASASSRRRSSRPSADCSGSSIQNDW